MVAQLEVDEEFAVELDFLSRFGVVPPFNDDHDLSNIFLAIRSQKGWQPSVRKESAGWRAEVREWRTISQSHVAIGRDEDRIRAVLKALSQALSWQSREEEFESFDRSVRTVRGFGGKEFLERWERNELDVNDPMISHLLILRPLGY